MDDFKHKILGIVNKQISSRSSASSSSESRSNVPLAESLVTSQALEVSARNKQEETRKKREENLVSLETVLDSIEEVYFTNEDFDTSRHELQKLPENLNCDIIETNCEKLQKQRKMVCHKFFELILQKEDSCNTELLRILEIQQELQTTLRTCHDARMHLISAKHQFITLSLGILANYHKRQVVKNLLHSLNTIKTLQCTEEHLQKLLNERNYPGAITLLLECQMAASTYRHFSCVAALGNKLQDTLEMAEEQLDQALARVCNHFDSADYGKIQAAYSLLGKTQIAMDQLHMHFVSAIHNATFKVLHGYVECSSEITHQSQTVLQKKNYRELCKLIKPDSFIPCLISLCESLWKIMRNYYQVITWHQKEDDEKLQKENSNTVDFEVNLNKEYIKQKLNSGLLRIWQDVETRVSVYLISLELIRYKFDEFLYVLGIVHRLIEIGEEFCGSKSENLQNSVRKQSINYLNNYHRRCLDELRLFLENEGWEICPVKPSFNILQLQEFRSLRHRLKCWKAQSGSLNHSDTSCGDNTSSGYSQDGSVVGGGYFSKYMDARSPFEIDTDATQEEDILADLGNEQCGYYSDDSDDDIPEQLKKDIMDENAGDSLTLKHSEVVSKKYSRRESKMPILTNTTLTVLRHCGKYIQMSQLLQLISFHIITCMTQLFDLYLYTVYSFFAMDVPVDIPFTGSFLCSLKLQATLKRIRDNMIIRESDLAESETGISEESKGKIHEPKMAFGIDLTQADTLCGLPERVVAVESLVFLAEQFEFLQGYLKQLLPLETRTDLLNQFHSPSVGLAVELRRPVYMCVSAKAVDFNSILSHMAKVDWEVKDVMSEHSKYVDILLRYLQIFAMRIEQITYRVPISIDVLTVLWENVLQLVCSMFVEGFSSGTKCSNGGRALMQLDFTQFLSKVQRLAPVKSVPGKEFVESYIKAYYLRESELEVWMKEHREYSTKQLLALVNCACASQSSKKVLQRLLASWEDSKRIR